MGRGRRWLRLLLSLLRLSWVVSGHVFYVVKCHLVLFDELSVPFLCVSVVVCTAGMWSDVTQRWAAES